MQVCFVIQPFDRGKYDKRYDDVYKYAIEAAGLEPYRVDRDPEVEVPIDAIEDGIRRAAICLADISSDNPNVWYELGYAFAAGKPVVMVCSDERAGRKYPFDIQHRTVIPYVADAPSDFDDLSASITERLQALMKKGDTLRQIAETEQVAPVAGLSQPELFVLTTLAGSTLPSGGGVSMYELKSDVERAGLTAIGFSIGVRRLMGKALIKMEQSENSFGESYDVTYMTDAGWKWVDANEEKFLLRREKKPKEEFDDDIPF